MLECRVKARLASLSRQLPISVSLARANGPRQCLEKTGPVAMADLNTALCPRRAIAVNPSSRLRVFSSSG